MTTSPDDLLGPSTEDDRSGTTEAEVARLRRQLRAERERSLNATDRVLGAQAEAAQARAEIKELQYRLHVREAELAHANELLGQESEPVQPLVERTARTIARRGRPVARRLAGRLRSATP